MRKSAFIAVLCALLTSSAFAQRSQSDRQFDGLRGPVKSVMTEVADYKFVAGESVEQGRVLSTKVAYDANGHWLDQQHYDSRGNLSGSLLFKFIGKRRVAISEDVVNENHLVRITPLPRSQRVDPRFTYRFRYKHDVKGNRVEEVMYHSTGSLYLRRVYRIRGKRKSVFLYSADGQLNQKLDYTFDNQGNEIKVLLREGVTGDKITYQYVEFDSEGNWTKRVVTRAFKDFDSSMAKPWNVEYRKLTYY